MSPASSEALISTLPSIHPVSSDHESDNAHTSFALTEFSKKTVNDCPSPPGCKIASRIYQASVMSSLVILITTFFSSE